MITVSAKKSVSTKSVAKYDNDESWNASGETAPNGVSAYRWLRETNPAPELLSPLALWLTDNLPPCVAGRMSSMQYRVTLISGKTEADLVRAEALNGRCNGTWWTGPEAVERASRMAENLIHCYDLENKQAQIDDWLFSQYDWNTDSDESYWNHEAEKMLSTGAKTVRIRVGGSTVEYQL